MKLTNKSLLTTLSHYFYSYDKNKNEDKSFTVPRRHWQFKSNQKRTRFVTRLKDDKQKRNDIFWKPVLPSIHFIYFIYLVYLYEFHSNIVASIHHNYQHRHRLRSEVSWLLPSHSSFWCILWFVMILVQAHSIIGLYIVYIEKLTWNISYQF